MDIRFFAMQDWVHSSKDIPLLHTPGMMNPSDDLTKPPGKVPHERHARCIMGHCDLISQSVSAVSLPQFHKQIAKMKNDELLSSLNLKLIKIDDLLKKFLCRSSAGTDRPKFQHAPSLPALNPRAAVRTKEGIQRPPNCFEI